MSIPVRQSTALELAIGPVLDADGVAVTDGVVADFKIKKTTGNFAALNGSATLTHVSAGMYDLVLTTSDTDTVGMLTIAIDDTVNACAPVRLQVIEEAVYDMLYAASAAGYIANQPVDVNTIKTNPVVNAGTVTFPTTATLASTTNITAGTITTTTNLTNAPTTGDLTATMKASVNTEVLDVLNTDTFAEPGQGAPAATTTLAAKIGYLFKAWRNKKDQTSSTYQLYADDASTVDQKATVSDDGTTTTIGEVATGP